jgi:hypothetical protein
MLGLSTSILKGVTTLRAYIKDGLKLYMPYRGGHSDEVKFVGTGSTSFDGTNDYVSVADDATLTSASGFSIACWVNLSTIAGDIAIITRNSDLTTFNSSSEFFIINDDGIAEFKVIDQTNNAMIGRKTGTVFTVNTWHYIVCTYNGGTTSAGCKIYVDGVQADTSDETAGSGFASVRDSGQELRFGEFADGGEDFTGNMKNIAFWSRALTATEIQNVMYKTYDEVGGRLASGLVSWWILESDYTDSKGSNDGTNTGTTQNADIYGGDTPVKPRAIDNAPTVQADAIGAGSASFVAASSNYVAIGDIGVNAYAICMWFKSNAVITSSSGGNKFLMNLNSNTYRGIVLGSFSVSATNELITIVDDDEHMSYYASASESISTDWHHLALSWNSTDTTYDIYLDGVLKPNTKYSTPELIDVDNLEFGRRGSGSGYWDGNICQVGIWDAALNQAQIQSIMEKTYDELTTSERADLVSYWPLDADGTDSHGSNNGTLE